MRLVLAAAAAWLGLAGAALGQAGVDLRDVSRDGPYSGRLTLAPGPEEAGRIALAATLDLPRLFPEADAIGAARGEGTGVSWVGPTRWLRAEGTSAILATRARGQVCVELLGREACARETKDVEVRVRPAWDGAGRRLRLEIEVLDVRRLGDDLEGALRDLGVPFAARLDLFALDDARLAEADLRVEPLAVEPLAEGLRLTLALSADRAGAASVAAALRPRAGDLSGALRALLLGAPG